MELTIAQTLTRPAGENRLCLEITMGSGAVHAYDIDARSYYGAVKQILLNPHTRKIGTSEPVSHASSHEDIPSPS